MIIDLPRFLAAGRPVWAELERMLDRLEQDAGASLSFEEVRRLYRLYQRVSTDLAKLQTFASRPDIFTYLESLTARAYAAIHETRDRGGDSRRSRVWTWFTHSFPHVFQRHWRAFLLSLALTLAGALFGAGATAFDPQAKAAIFPTQFGHLQGDPAERVRQEESNTNAGSQGVEARFSASLMQNNIRVSILLLALGMTWGLGSIIVLFYNGVILGAVVLDYVRAGQTTFLLGWLLPHGVIEIPAVLIAGQAGLLIGKALLGGGERTTVKERFRALGPDLIILIGGVAVMLVWAGLVEAFFSQLHAPVLPYSVKITFGVVELILLCWFLRRRRKVEEVPA